MDTFYEILKIAWVIPEGGLDPDALLAIEDGSVEVLEDESARIGDAPPEGFSDEAEQGEEEAVQEDDPPVEPALSEPGPSQVVAAEPDSVEPVPDVPSDPYMEKAVALLKLRTPKLDEGQDSQVVRASSTEFSTASPAVSAATDSKPPPITPKKLFQEEPSLVLTPDDMSMALARKRQQLRPKLYQLAVRLGSRPSRSVAPFRAELIRRLEAQEAADKAKSTWTDEALTFLDFVVWLRRFEN